MLDYASLSALTAVVREGSFERAARALHVTPSAVSQRIRLLEERIGCALVVQSIEPGSTSHMGLECPAPIEQYPSFPPAHGPWAVAVRVRWPWVIKQAAQQVYRVKRFQSYRIQYQPPAKPCERAWRTGSRDK